MAKAKDTISLLVKVKNFEKLEGGAIRIIGDKVGHILLPARIAIPDPIKRNRSYKCEVLRDDLARLGKEQIQAVTFEGPVTIATGGVSTREG